MIMNIMQHVTLDKLTTYI